MRTLLLDTAQWDLVIDVDHNIAVASNPYSLAQDAASAIKLFLGEDVYDTTSGLPYFQEVLGFAVPLSLLKALFVQAALTVPEVTSAACFIAALGADRVINGQVQIKDSSGTTTAANF